MIFKLPCDFEDSELLKRSSFSREKNLSLAPLVNPSNAQQGHRWHGHQVRSNASWSTTRDLDEQLDWNKTSSKLHLTMRWFIKFINHFGNNSNSNYSTLSNHHPSRGRKKSSTWLPWLPIQLLDDFVELANVPSTCSCLIWCILKGWEPGSCQ